MDDDSLKPSTDDSALAEQLASLQLEVCRLTDFLSQQNQARLRRRRKITLRLLLSSVAVLAIVFAWFSAKYHSSRRNAASVDQLINQGVFVLYEPRDELGVSLLPGSPDDPPDYLKRTLGDDFFRKVTNVSTNTQFGGMNKKQVIPAVASLSDVKRLRLRRLSLTTGDLNPLASLSDLESLDLGATRLDNGSLPWLRHSKIRWLNVSHTWLGDNMAFDLARCPDLQYLHMERTTITDEGLKQLHGKTSLTYLNLKRCPVSLNAVKALSDTIPNCVIDWQPLKLRDDGRVDALAARRGAVRLGRGVPQDPRGGPMPPSDTYGQNPRGGTWVYDGRTAPTRSYRSRYILDAY